MEWHDAEGGEAVSAGEWQDVTVDPTPAADLPAADTELTTVIEVERRRDRRGRAARRGRVEAEDPAAEVEAAEDAAEVESDGS